MCRVFCTRTVVGNMSDMSHTKQKINNSLSDHLLTWYLLLIQAVPLALSSYLANWYYRIPGFVSAPINIGRVINWCDNGAHGGGGCTLWWLLAGL